MDKFAIIGNPVEHSLSPQIHQVFSKQAGIKLTYEKIEAPLNDFFGTLMHFRAQGGKGCNITLPFKEEAYNRVTKLGSNAQIAQSVNCIEFQDDDTIYGDNFDGVGLVEDLIKNKNIALSFKKILIIGAGGAARGIIEPLLQKAPQSLTLINRTYEKAHLLAAHFSHLKTVQAILIEALPAEPFDLIINATSAGHHGKLPNLPKKIIADYSICYDLSYGKAAKPFLEWASLNGCKNTFDGFGMLVEQAAASFYLWSGIYPSTEEIIKKGLDSNFC